MSSEKMNYISYGQSVDGTNYCSGVETLAENLIEDNENDAVIVFPSKTGWASMRSSAYRMTTGNVEAVLPLPIYKIKRMYLLLENDMTFSWQGVTSYEKKLTDFKNKDGESIGVIDITSLVLTKTEWNALGSENRYIHALQKQCQENTLYWEQGDLIISIGDRASDFLRRVLFCAGSDYSVSVNVTGNTTLREASGYSLDFDARNWQFRIEYIPVTTKTKLRARKNERTNVEYMQPHNQRAEINAVSAFGKNMWLTAQKTGARTATVVKKYTRLADIPPVGALVRHNGKRYRLVANSYLQTNIFYMQVTHTLSENWTSRSKHVSVDQKYRNYNIPQDILWRNLYWEDYVTVSGEKKTINQTENAGVKMSPIIQLFFCETMEDKTIDSFCWFFDGSLSEEETQVLITSDMFWGDPNASFLGCVCPCSTYGTANSMVFSAAFKDQLSSGLRIADKNESLCEDVRYCGNDGRIESARIALSEGVDTYFYNTDNTPLDWGGNGIDSDSFPMMLKALEYEVDKDVYYNAPMPQNCIFDKKLYIDKDPGEALKFTYQVHFVTEGDCVVGNKLAEHNPLVKRYETGRTLKVWLLTSYIREGVDKLENPSGAEYIATTETEKANLFTVSSDGDYYARILLSSSIKGLLQNYKAWAITDENNNLYVGRNGDVTGNLYFCISHKRP